MKKILFHSHQFNYRGVTNSLVDYAKYNRELLGNESVLIYNKAFNKDGLDIHSSEEVIDKLKKDYEVLSYTTTEELNDIASKFDAVYSQKAGHKEEPIITTTRDCVHCVFQYFEPHGDRYAYISQWLSENVGDKQRPFVPYIVNLPESNPDASKNFRKKYGISDEQYVFGRLGGFETFDIPFVKENVVKLVHKFDHLVFMFANTAVFYEHPRIIYTPAFFGQQEKSDYIGSCDAMLHARNLGESFGLSVAEFLFHNKPVISWMGGFDGNHRVMLKNPLCFYGEHNVYDRILGLRNRPKLNYKSWVSEFTPEAVMKKFNEVFLSED